MLEIMQDQSSNLRRNLKRKKVNDPMLMSMEGSMYVIEYAYKQI